MKIARDKKTNAILNEDNDGLNEYKKIREKRRSKNKKIDSLEERVSLLEGMLRELINKK